MSSLVKYQYLDFLKDWMLNITM